MMPTGDVAAQVLRLLGPERADPEEPLAWRRVWQWFAGLNPQERAEARAALVDMISLRYRNPAAEGESPWLQVRLPEGMSLDDLLSLETAALIAAEAGWGEALPRLQATLRDARWHAVYPNLRLLHQELQQVLGRLGETWWGRYQAALQGLAMGEALWAEGTELGACTARIQGEKQEAVGPGPMLLLDAFVAALVAPIDAPARRRAIEALPCADAHGRAGCLLVAELVAALLRCPAREVAAETVAVLQSAVSATAACDPSVALPRAEEMLQSRASFAAAAGLESSATWHVAVAAISVWAHAATPIEAVEALRRSPAGRFEWAACAAALAGGLVGLSLGQEALPRALLVDLPGRLELVAAADRLASPLSPGVAESGILC